MVAEVPLCRTDAFGCDAPFEDDLGLEQIESESTIVCNRQLTSNIETSHSSATQRAVLHFCRYFQENPPKDPDKTRLPLLGDAFEETRASLAVRAQVLLQTIPMWFPSLSQYIDSPRCCVMGGHGNESRVTAC